MSPEYAMHGHFSMGSDVFSFGVLILEIISGKKNSCFHASDRGEDLLNHAWKLWKDGMPLELMDPTLADSHARNEVMRCIQMGLLCVQEDVDTRPSMATIVLMLGSYTVSLPLPEQPPFFFRSRTKSQAPKGLELDKSMGKSAMKVEMGSSFTSERSFMWKKAQEIKKMLELENKVDDGSIMIEGSSNILTMALGTAEHFGNVPLAAGPDLFNVLHQNFLPRSLNGMCIEILSFDASERFSRAQEISCRYARGVPSCPAAVVAALGGSPDLAAGAPAIAAGAATGDPGRRTTRLSTGIPPPAPPRVIRGDESYSGRKRRRSRKRRAGPR
ncbi:hypothetical protein LguiA_029260 [Lonicera macranthoides]